MKARLNSLEEELGFTDKIDTMNLCLSPHSPRNPAIIYQGG
jgi:hypothetical protein